MNAQEKYQAECVQSEKDHHTPTAGAMISHILANLMVHRTKVKQAKHYLEGPARTFAEPVLKTMEEKEDTLFDRLSQLVLDEGELIPTTFAEFNNYAMIKESGQLKYEPAEVILGEIVKDLDTQNLFVTRAIALAEQEEKFLLAAFLKELYGWLKHQIFLFQQYLGKDTIDKMLEEEED
ncbi:MULTISPECIES: ferritin-like domain-containing protein [unclassified Enterococcus]|uniref:ferritin-like domain-containing protein n=1 Tax=unclassified Enterococcus TaxID=2608891 RepID=UPI0013EB089E|nr:MULTISPECIES: ferritin-like domain-containing protein [unclassified Enterococcus]